VLATFGFGRKDFREVTTFTIDPYDAKDFDVTTSCGKLPPVAGARKLGIVLLIGGAITVDTDVLDWHLPVLIAMTALSAVFLATGRLRRWHGVVLLALYAAYFVLSIVVFNGVPLDSS